MSTVKDLFLKAVNEGMKSAAMIQEPAHKANAYAAIAHALALTGLAGSATGDTGIQTDSTPASAAPAAAATGKNALKPDAGKKAETTPAPAAVEPEAPEAELTDEWTDEAIAIKADGIAFIGQLKENYDEASLDQCVQQFSEGQLQTLGEISPLNIDAFVAFMEAMIAQANE